MDSEFFCEIRTVNNLTLRFLLIWILEFGITASMRVTSSSIQTILKILNSNYVDNSIQVMFLTKLVSCISPKSPRNSQSRTTKTPRSRIFRRQNILLWVVTTENTSTGDLHHVTFHHNNFFLGLFRRLCNAAWFE